jgi:hypothetical protein
MREGTIDGVDGVWRATLQRTAGPLRLILRITTSTRGTRAKLDSPDAGIAGLDVADIAGRTTLTACWRLEPPRPSPRQRYVLARCGCHTVCGALTNPRAHVSSRGGAIQ